MAAKAAHSTRELVDAARTWIADSNAASSRAGELLTSAALQDPIYPNVLLLRSGVAGKAGLTSAAVADVSLALELDRGGTDAHRTASLLGSRASLYTRLFRHEDAATDLRAALKVEPDNGTWAYELGRVLMKQEKVQLAQLYFQRALQEPLLARMAESLRPRVYARYGRSCLLSRDYAKAKTLLHRALEIGGDGATVLHDVGLAHYYEGTAPSAAVDYLAQAVKLDAQRVAYPLHLSLAQVRCGNHRDALSSINNAVLRSGGDGEGWLRFYRGCIALELGLRAEALADAEAAAAAPMAANTRGNASATSKPLSPPPAYAAMALVHLFCESPSLSAAVPLLVAALRRHLDRQQRAMIGLLLGMVHQWIGDSAMALLQLTDVLTALTRSSTSSTLSKLVSGSPMSANRRLRSDLELLTLTHAGLVCDDANYTDLALRYFTEACACAEAQEEYAAEAVLLYRRAVTQVKLRDHCGALESLQMRLRVLASAPSAAEIMSLSLSHSAGTLSATFASRNHPTLVEVHAVPEGEDAHVHAVALRRLGRFTEALALADTAASTAASTGVGAYIYNRALIHFALTRYTEALADVAMCKQAYPNICPVELHYLEGSIAHATGDAATALRCLEAALAADVTLRTCPPFAYSLGILLTIAGRHAEAVAAFTSAIDCAGTVTATSSCFSRLECGATTTGGCPLTYLHERAKTYQQLGQYAQALADYNRILPDPTSSAKSGTSPRQANWNALVNRSLTLKELHRYEAAAIDWDAARRLDESGLLAQLHSQDVYELSYLDLCEPGCEFHHR